MMSIVPFGGDCTGIPSRTTKEDRRWSLLRIFWEIWKKAGSQSGQIWIFFCWKSQVRLEISQDIARFWVRILFQSCRDPKVYGSSSSLCISFIYIYKFCTRKFRRDFFRLDNDYCWADMGPVLFGCNLNVVNHNFKVNHFFCRNFGHNRMTCPIPVPRQNRSNKKIHWCQCWLRASGYTVTLMIR